TNWSDIGELPAAGNSDSEEEYFLVHKEPEVGVNYYRLIQTDHNGTEHHSDVRSAVFKASEITFYPNPASDRVWFKGDLAAVQSINVYDMQGKLVLHQNGNSDVIREMDINQLERGAYVVEFIYVDGTSYRNKLQVNG
ncbi:MAG: T9SS type A sorting domain-containing protein, partial [Flavobacteriales bacterium]|nr:T9SS type A sorting domain-containing protein [Flavobacteriales bacterium]